MGKIKFYPDSEIECMNQNMGWFEHKLGVYSQLSYQNPPDSISGCSCFVKFSGGMPPDHPKRMFAICRKTFFPPQQKSCIYETQISVLKGLLYMQLIVI